MTSVLSVILVVAAGAAVGSFLNVVIIRSHDGHSWFGGRSRCPHCQRSLNWWELIPIISFIFLRGRCHTCHGSIHWQYPLVELLTAIAFFIAWYLYGVSMAAGLTALVSATMILIAVYDARWSLIPDEFTASFALSSALFIGLTGQPIVLHLLGAAAGAAFFGLQYVISRGRWVGSGDLLLGAALGLLLGWQMLALALFLAYMVGSILAISLIVARRLQLRQSVPFGPYLVFGSYIAWLWGPQIVDYYFAHALFL